MLSFLSISDFAIVDDVSIELGPGLNVLTGETGAGKSIVVDAIALLLGGRSGPEMIRSGCERLVVEAQFDLSARPDAAAVASEAGPEIEAPEGELLIRREVAAGGRGRCLVNGRLVTVAALRRLGEALADLHGQHQHQSLLREEGQRDALDRFGGTLARRGEVASLHARRLALQREIEEASSRERERARRQESLQREIAEIEALDPRPGEEASLAREESLLRHAGEVSRLASEAFALLSDDDDAAVTRLAAAGERLARLAAIDPAAQRAAALAGEAR
ncbi:MAG TPA: AAA family ATPase, partial [Candidatus Polarisedimenticolia bacterium]|nr:AAA family ATPase [Candidatus Polarisedimenticolia bacterium]